MTEHIPTFDSLRLLQADSITTMEKNLASIRGENAFIMQTWRTTLLKGLMHWVQDNERCGRNPSMAHNLTVPMLHNALNRAESRKRVSVSTDTAPPVFKESEDFYRWAEMMYNHLNTILGVKGVPLSYVIRTNDYPQYDFTDSVEMQHIKLAPLHGESFQTDAATVHNIILGKISQIASSWIRSNQMQNNGRSDMQTLFNVYTGFGNKSARLAQANSTRDTLHYRDEKSFPFNRFLHLAQVMFEIFSEQGRGMTDDAKCDFILEKCAGCSYLTTEIGYCEHLKLTNQHPLPFIIHSFQATIAKRQTSFRYNRTSDNRISDVTVVAANTNRDPST